MAALARALVLAQWTLVACDELALLQHQVSHLERPAEPRGAGAPSITFRLGNSVCTKARLGNLLFEWASLMGLARLASPDARLCYSDGEGTEYSRAFHRDFQLDRLAGSCGRAPPAPIGCAVHWSEVGRIQYSESAVDWLRERIQEKRECDAVDVVVKGCLQSWRYFDGIRTDIRQVLAPPQDRHDEADRWLAAQREVLAKEAPGAEWRFVGVQVRLGDKVHVSRFVQKYAPTSWSFFSTGMRQVREALARLHPKAKVAFVVTVGGAKQGRGPKEAMQDHAAARQGLAEACGDDARLLFTEGADSLTDFAVLTKMDGLVLSGSSYGWWAAYLSNASEAEGLVVAPRHLFRPTQAKALREYSAEDLYPRNWTLLDNMVL